MTARTIRNIERGRTRPYLYNLIALLDALDLPSAERTAILDTWHGGRSPVVAGGLPGPASCGASSRHIASLPAPLMPIIGREAEQTEIDALLRRGPAGFPVRLLTLAGRGGGGKTRLALEAACGLRDQFIDGTAFISLTAVDDPALLLPTMASALGWDSAAVGAPLIWLKGRLRTSRILLVLDNFEHLLVAAHRVTELLETCPNLAVLTTSRAPLRLYGEHIFPVAPLALPLDDIAATLEGLALVPSVALFIRRVRAVQPRFLPTPVNAPTVAAICRRLDGLPLALELAAGRLSSLSPSALLAELEDPLAALVDGPRDVPSRRQTLRASLAWSYDLLTAAQQTLFRRLSIFNGGWTMSGARALDASVTPASRPPDNCVPMPENGFGPCTILDSLSALIDHGLVTLEPQADPAIDYEQRYVMLRTSQDYGLDRLRALGEEPRVRRAHALWFADWVEQAEPHLLTGARDIRLRRLDRERENLHAALDWCVATHEHYTALRLGGGLIWYWYFRGRIGDGQRRLEDILASIAAEERSRYAEAAARVLWGAGRMAHLLGEARQADHRLAESVALWRRVGDLRGLAYALTDQGKIAFSSGDMEAARARAEESVTLFQECGDRWGGAFALQQLGRVALAQHKENKAESLYRQVLSIFDQLGDSWGRGMPLLGLGRLALTKNRLAEARLYLEESLAIFEQRGERRLSAVALSRLGRLADKEGDAVQAAICCRRSIALRCELGQFRSIGMPLATLAGLANERGQAEDAARLWGAAEVLLERRLGPANERDIDYQTALSVAIRRGLNDTRLAVCRQEGRALHREQVVALALAQ